VAKSPSYKGAAQYAKYEVWGGDLPLTLNLSSPTERFMIEFNFFSEDARFHHLGVAVRSIKEVSPLSEPIIDPIQKVAVAFVCLNGTQLELIEPYGKQSPIARSLVKGVKLLHVCYAVPDLEAAIKTCRRYGFHCIGRPVPAVAFDDRKIAWVYSNQYGLFELLEGPGTIINGNGESR